ncbi:MAG: hypothetical protein V4772_17270 [Pseudomonadota bacterium]
MGLGVFYVCKAACVSRNAQGGYAAAVSLMAAAALALFKSGAGFVMNLTDVVSLMQNFEFESTGSSPSKHGGVNLYESVIDMALPASL